MLKIKMKKIKILIVTFVVLNFSILSNAKEVPKSFADLAETINTFCC